MSAVLFVPDITARLRAQLDMAILVSDKYQSNYTSDFGKVYPAVWVVGQRSIAKGDGRGYTNRLIRQDFRCDVAITLVSKLTPDKNDPVDFDAAQAMKDLDDSVSNAIFGWTAPGCAEPFVWQSATDGPSFQAACSRTVVFSTVITTQKRT